MKTYIKIISISLLPSILSLNSCTDPNNRHACDEVIFCTEHFVSLGVDLKFTTIDAKNFHSIETFLDSTGEKIFSSTQINPPFDEVPQNSVIFLNDNHINKVTLEGSTVTVKFFSVGGGLINEVKFIVRHDCCHVEKVGGPEVVEL